METYKQLTTLQDEMTQGKEKLKSLFDEQEMEYEEKDLASSLEVFRAKLIATKKSTKEDLEKIKQERFNADNKNVELSAIIKRLETDKSDLLSILKHKEVEISELKRINQSLHKNNSDPILQRFNSLTAKEKDPKETDEKDEEISRLKHELDQVYNKLDEVEAHLSFIQKKFIIQKKDFNSQVEFEEEKPEPSKIKGSQVEAEVKGSLSLAANKNDGAESEEEDASRAYLKNLITRYMVYEAKKNEVECSVVRRAILDCLGVGREDRALIDEALNNKGGIKDAVSFLNIFSS